MADDGFSSHGLARRKETKMVLECPKVDVAQTPTTVRSLEQNAQLLVWMVTPWNGVLSWIGDSPQTIG